MNREWGQRDCDNCKLRLGCPHSLFAGEFIIEPPEFTKATILEELCSRNKILRNDDKM